MSWQEPFFSAFLKVFGEGLLRIAKSRFLRGLVVGASLASLTWLIVYSSYTEKQIFIRFDWNSIGLTSKSARDFQEANADMEDKLRDLESETEFMLNKASEERLMEANLCKAKIDVLKVSLNSRKDFSSEYSELQEKYGLISEKLHTCWGAYAVRGEVKVTMPKNSN